jgi:hypothetical protein
MLRYVVLHHTGYGEPHFDLMFETAPGQALRTWRSSIWPIISNTPITPLADHRAEYLVYEGPVSSGRGEVRRIETGEFEVLFSNAAGMFIRFITPRSEEWAIAHSRVDPAANAVVVVDPGCAQKKAP